MTSKQAKMNWNNESKTIIKNQQKDKDFIKVAQSNRLFYTEFLWGR